MLDNAQRSVERKKNLACAAANARKAVDLCPGLSDRAAALVAQYDKAESEARFTETSASSDGHWVLTWTRGWARVWELTPSGLKLAWRLAADANWTMPADGFAIGYGGDDDSPLHVIDLAGDRQKVFPNVKKHGLVDGNLLLGNGSSIRRIEWPSMIERETVSVALEMANGDPFRLAARGRSVIVDGALVSLDSGKVLLKEQRFLDVSADGTRIAACGSEEATLGIYDTSTGQPVARWPLGETPNCTYVTPAISPDGRYCIGLNIDRDAGERSYASVMVYDSVTKRVSQSSAKVEFSLGTYGGAVTIGNGSPPVICMGTASQYMTGSECPFTLGAEGRITRRPANAVRKTALDPKQKEAVRTASRDGSTTVLVTYEDHSRPGKGPDFRNLRALVADSSSGRVSAAYDLIAGAVDQIEANVSILFVDATHALIESGLESKRRFVLDLASGVKPLQVGGEFAWVDGTRFGRQGDSLIDLSTLNRYSLTPSDEALRRAKSYIPCP